MKGMLLVTVVAILMVGCGGAANKIKTDQADNAPVESNKDESTPVDGDRAESDKNQPPVIANQFVEAVESADLIITLGPVTDRDGDAIQYTTSNSINVTQSNQSNEIIYNRSSAGVEFLTITASDNIADDVEVIITITTSAALPSNFITSRELINPVYGNDAPVKGESRIDPVTGTKITRLTDSSELDGTDDALIVYSRYTPENTSGKYFLAFGSNSTSSWLVERETGNVISEVLNMNNHSIGESNEVRWDISGNFPNRLYYREGMSFYRADLVSRVDEDSSESIYSFEHELLKDFSSLVPSSIKIYNDVEGDSSNDSDHWAFMAVHYDGVTFVVDAFIHFQVSTGDTHIMRPEDLANTNLDLEKDKDYFSYRPNMVEVSPLGTGIVIHMGRKWDDVDYGGSSIDYIDTWFDGPHLWPLDFDHAKQEPVKISVGETHAGWSFDEVGREMFVSQNNRTDYLDAVYIGGPNAGHVNNMGVAEHMEFAYHGDFGWSNGFHYGKMPLSKKGWTFINTYSDVNHEKHDADWGADQLIMIKIDHITNNPRIWRIAPNYNEYAGSYRDEAPAAINTLGNRIYATTNWGGLLPNREVFVFELPSNWNTVLE